MDFSGEQSGTTGASEQKAPGEVPASRNNAIIASTTASSTSTSTSTMKTAGSSSQQGPSDDHQEHGATSPDGTTVISDIKQPMKTEPVHAEERELAVQAPATTTTPPAPASIPPTKSKNMDYEEYQTTPLIPSPTLATLSDGRHHPKVETTSVKDKLVKHEGTSTETRKPHSFIEADSTKKRPRSPVDGKVTPVDPVTKKTRVPGGLGPTINDAVGREEKSTATGIDSTSESDAKKRPRSPIQEMVVPKDKFSKKIRALDSISTVLSASIEQAPSTQEIQGDGGIFDDAEEDESFDISTTKKAPPPPSAYSTSLRPDLIAAILGSAPKNSAATIFGSAPINLAVPQPAVATIMTAPIKNNKVIKRKLQVKKTFKGKKEQEAAEKLVHGKIDLMTVLPERDCRFLAEKMWIVTVTQLETVLNAKEGEEMGFRNELIDAIISSNFLTDGGISRDSPRTGSSEKVTDRVTDAREEEEMVKLEAHPVVAPACAPLSLKVATTSSIRPDIVNPSNKDAAETIQQDSVQTPGGMLKMEEDPIPVDISSSAPHEPKVGATDTGSAARPALATDPTSEEESISRVDASRLKDPDQTPGGTSVVKTQTYSVDTSSYVPPDPKIDAASSTGPAVTDSTGEGSTPRENVSQQELAKILVGTVEAEARSMPIIDTSHSAPRASKVAATDYTGPAVTDPNTEENISQVNASQQEFTHTSGGISREAAEKLVDLWSVKLQTRKPSNESNGTRNQFLLDGPLSCLISRCTLNFFASANIQTAVDFLNLRRTETGVIVDMYKLWRRKCGYGDGSSGTIAKQLISVGMRLEVAIGSTSAPKKELRRWFGGHLSILTGQAKEFFFDYSKIYDSSFITLKTNDLAEKLKLWRDSKGLPPLKGTGKVAMISSWKTLVKEAMDLEKERGRVLKNADLLKTVEAGSQPVTSKSSDAPKTPTSKKAQPAKPTKKSPEVKVARDVPVQLVTPPKVRAALVSKEFLVDVFKKKETTNVLASVGITTAQELLAADRGPNSQMVQAIIKMRKDFSGVGSIEPDSCVRLVYDWCRRVKAKLAEIEKPPTQESKKSKVGQTRKENAGQIGVQKKVEKGSRKFADPFDALSVMAKTFLGSIDVKDAESFLAAKTKYLADSFGKYRENNNMPPLKGLGNVASISGWKAIVRKAAEESGQGRLVTLNAGRNAGKKLKKRRPREENGTDKPQSSPQENTLARPSEGSSREVHKEVFTGGSKTKFWVDSGEYLGHVGLGFFLARFRFSHQHS
jgi:hypothetical protein